jgi:Zn-dependent protease
MVLFPIVGIFLSGWPFGFASTPYDPFWARSHPRRAALMALAGPVSNLFLAVLAGLALRFGAESGALLVPNKIRFGHIAGATQEGSSWETAAFLLGVIFSMNLLLFVFNLLPLPPMDGSGALPLVLTERATAAYQDFIYGNPMLGLIGMFAAWQLIGPIFEKIFAGAVGLLYGVQYS